MKKITSFWIAVAAVFTLAAVAPAAGTYRIIVHADNPIDSLTKKDVSRMFMKKVTAWENGEKVDAIDLRSSSDARQEFSREILGIGVPQVRSYWQKMSFSGRGTPPMEFESDAEAIDFVRDNPGALGYVSADVDLGDGIKVLEVE